jgi:excisionase family DNA binding protein
LSIAAKTKDKLLTILQTVSLGGHYMSANLLSLAEVAAILGKPEVTVKRLAREHLLESVMDGKNMKFPEEDVKRFLEISKRLHK